MPLAMKISAAQPTVPTYDWLYFKSLRYKHRYIELFNSQVILIGVNGLVMALVATKIWCRENPNNMIYG